jgi:protein phosphatase 1 regulatory subunit 7
MPPEKETSPLHISVADDADGHHKSGVTPRSSSGWDGKLRVEKKPELANPEALSDPEYSEVCIAILSSNMP